MIDVGLIENNNILRQSITRYFKKTKIFNVIFSVNDIKNSLEFSDAFPKLILLDVYQDALTGVNTIPLLRRIYPEARIVILSDTDDEKLNNKALKKGAVALLSKSSSLATITALLIKISRGEAPSFNITNAPVAQLLKTQSDQGTNVELTVRELELIELLSEGIANKVAADKLGVTYFTVNQHLKNIYKKLKINSKAQLIAWYLNNESINKYSWK